MTRFEELLSEYSNDLDIKECDMRTEGLYGDSCIWIDKKQTQSRKVCILAEEIGHHKLTVGNILDQSDLSNAKQEHKARKWAYKKLIPFSSILHALKNGHIAPYEMADYIGVDERFLRECLVYYGFL